ncbi:MAG: hypothetical protein LBT52_05980 [Clostridiales Family XIII bacterium]|nr:hypothetical protein [Clostridiales Family XIII bacterium]
MCKDGPVFPADTVIWR